SEGVAVATQDDPPTKIAELPLTAFELPTWLVEPAVRSCRLFNTALDFIFYDVPTLRAALAEKDAPMQARGEKPPSRIIDFDAMSDPESGEIHENLITIRVVGILAFVATSLCAQAQSPTGAEAR